MTTTVHKMSVTDIVDVMRIEKKSYSHTWSREAFESIVESKKTRSKVARVDGTNAGFLVYRPFRHKILLQGLGVTPEHRRKGVGSALFKTIHDDLERNKKLYNRIIVPVLERELIAQLFLKHMGLLAIGILRAEDVTEDDTIVFRYKVNRQVKRYNIRRKARTQR